ncbi:MAG: GNAT family N-acetyltransferase [Bacteroidia bacterium]|nr:GNAT family N-acetyltransferase [Bacteroidia bacterium]
MLEINFQPFPVIETARLILRHIEETDVHEVFFLRSDETVMKYINKPLAKSLDDARDFISRVDELEKSNTGINWAISIHGDKKLIGNVSIWRIDAQHHRGEVGYVLHLEHHGKGIMQEAMEAVLDYGFRILKLHSIEANVNPANEASIKLLERNNFICEGYFKENYFFENRFLDTAIYSLLTPIKN